jgi:hypothetical protein
MFAWPHGFPIGNRGRNDQWLLGPVAVTAIAAGHIGFPQLLSVKITSEQRPAFEQLLCRYH